MTVRVVVAPVEGVLHNLVVHPLVLEVSVRLFNLHKVVYQFPEDPVPPLGRERLRKLLSFREPLVERFTEDVSALVFPRVFVPLVPDLVEPLEVEGRTAHRATGASPFQVPRLDATGTKVVPTAQLLEGTALSIAD